MKYIVVEDEFYARKSLVGMIKELRPGWILDYHSESVEDVVGYLASGHQPDICFMDVELVDGNCFDIFRRHATDTPVVFTTAYHGFMQEAFEVNAVGYLLKPIEKEALRKTIEKFERLHTGSAKEVPETSASVNVRRILTSVGNQYDYVDYDDVAWFVSEDKYVFVVTTDGRKSLTSFRSLSAIEPLLDAHRFHRINRAMIIAISGIDKITKYFKGRLEVSMKAGERKAKEIISASKKDDFLAWIGNRF